MDQIKDQIEKVLQELTISSNEINPQYNAPYNEEEDKKTKKRFKKYQIDKDDTREAALEKFTKLSDELFKSYQLAAKSFGKVKLLQNSLENYQIQKNKALDQKKVIDNLYTTFRTKYEQEIKTANNVEKQEQLKRKSVIEDLQDRIKKIQDKYQQAGKLKIEKYRQNQTLKHQMQKLQPHAMATQSLYQAQLKKKSVEIQIQMTTLKQKIQMMSSFKTMSKETQEKLATAEKNQEKIGKRVAVLEGKEQQHKILMAKAHLVFEDYKKTLNVLKDILPKKQKDALLINQKAKQSQTSLVEMQSKLNELDEQYQVQLTQLEGLKNLQKNLQKELQAL